MERGEARRVRVSPPRSGRRARSLAIATNGLHPNRLLRRRNLPGAR
jgi:hypothetical protein